MIKLVACQIPPSTVRVVVFLHHRSGWGCVFWHHYSTVDLLFITVDIYIEIYTNIYVECSLKGGKSEK